MPILNPRQACSLLNYQSKDIDDLFPFIISLLSIASEHHDDNDRALNEVHQKFFNFIAANIDYFSSFLKLTPQELRLFEENIETSNIYQVIYDLISSRKDFTLPKEKKYQSIKIDFIGDLKTKINSKMKIPKDQIFLYIPYHDKNFGWFISDHLYAVLVFQYKLYNRDPSISNENLFKMKFTTFLLAASGYTLVSCLSYNDQYFSYFPMILKPKLFSETHVFVETKLVHYNNINPINSENFLKKNLGFVYLYIHIESDEFNSLSDKSTLNYVKDVKKCNIKNVKIFLFSKEINKVFLVDEIKSVQSILFDKNSIHENGFFTPSINDLSGVDNKTLSITLCNVPLYSSQNKSEDFTPLKLSGFAFTEIRKSDFKYNYSKRIHVRIDEEEFYIDFNDIHFMNMELFVAEPMYLAETSFNISIVENIQATYKNNPTRLENYKIKNSDIKENIEEKMRNAFHYLYKYTKDENGKNIEPYTSQIFAVYQAISYMKEYGEKGVVLQVHTGEGKSFIVQALAEHLARQGNIVHIATSNIILAARDFEKAYNYYTNCEIKPSNKKQQKPSILIHRYDLNCINSMINDKSIISEQEFQLFYDEENFNNPTNMNISVCLNNNSNIIYSTFLNFEAFYLNQYERNPDYVSNYYNNCYLIIDEADTILIDELHNGTIISKPMKSNAAEVLEDVYYYYTRGIENAESVLKIIKDKYPECADMEIKDINKMFSEIRLVRSDDFSLKNKYIITDKPNDDTKKVIVPFDSEHKGIAEYNKVFNGFIHQFVGIKEKNESMKNLEIQPLTIDYMFVSHPVYVGLYKGVCGVTGTLGSKEDIKILKDYYKLSTLKIPRHQMNLRNNLPMIVCDSIKKRNKLICQEILNFHKLNYPVLAVFINLIEIDCIKKKLIKFYGIKKEEILVFDGSNSKNAETDKNLLEENSGKPGLITLGTNFCGRGVSIKYVDKPLCIIVSYYSQDERSIKQVLGRSGRNGKPGISRIICTKDMRYGTTILYNRSEMISNLDHFDDKKSFHNKYLTEIRKNHNWIFDESQNTELISKKEALCLRQSNLNVNRITACNAKFPVCMSLKTFLNIQSQRIFSLKNCPECKYTWNLFRIYMRELIFESWSLFISTVDEKISKSSIYSLALEKEYNNFLNILYQYIPHGESKFTIFQAFEYICNKVIANWEKKIIVGIPNRHIEINNKDKSYTSFKIGFYPMCLTENSGARLTPLTPSQQEKADKGNLYIIDPELRYLKKNSNERFSITVMIDKIYEKFQEVVDEKLQGLFGIRFFLRRTLAGCEFGVCVDPMYEFKDEFINCLIDRNPIIMLTICTKSSFPWIAGILMIVLVFVVSISIMIGKRIINPLTLPTDILNIAKKAWSLITKKKEEDEEESLLDSFADKLNPLFDGIITLLQNMIVKNLKKVDGSLNVVFETILNLFVPIKIDNFNEELSDKFMSNIKINEKAKQYMNGSSPFGKMIKIGVLVVLLIATFIMNFKNRKQINFISSTKTEASLFMKEDKNASSLPKKDLLDYNSFAKAKREVNPTIKEDFTIDSESSDKKKK